MLGLFSLLVTTAALGLASIERESGGAELWAGHQIAYGTRRVPFRGQVRTRTDTWLLARVHRSEGALVLEQRACAIAIEPVAGVEVRMEAAALPRDRVRFALQASGRFAGASRVAGGEEDIDDDGHPGMTVVVDSSVCSGDLYVSNSSTSRALASFDASGASFHGLAQTRVDQTILGARGACLRVMARDTRELVRGPFRYVPVPRDATCRSLLREGWPVVAEE